MSCYLYPYDQKYDSTPEEKDEIFVIQADEMGRYLRVQ